MEKRFWTKGLIWKWLTFGITFLLIAITFIPCINSNILDEGYKYNAGVLNETKEYDDLFHKSASANTTYYAIIAACSEYKDSNNSLPIPENKLTILYNVLVNADNWHEDNIILLLNENATKQNIVNAFDEMANLVTQNDIFLFSWSGHGSQVLDDDGDERAYDPC